MTCKRFPNKQALPCCELCAFWALCLAADVSDKLRHVGIAE